VTDIRFGTDGWRALIADEFTFANVSRCALGLANHLKAQGVDDRGLVVGYDTRFLSKEFAATVAGVCASQGIRVFLADRPAPTPVMSYNVLHRRAGGAAIVTASHNPPNWNGFKFKPEYGGSAPQQITDLLEVEIGNVSPVDAATIEAGHASGLVAEFDPSAPYLAAVGGSLDLPAIRSAGFRVITDSMYGAGAGYLSELLAGGRTTIEEIHGYRNPAFPGMDQPEPISQNLGELTALVSEQAASVGIALDGDADRVGIIDEAGRFITTLNVFSMLALYLIEEKAQRGSIIKGVTASQALNKMGELFGVDVHEVPVGFKNMGPKMAELDAIMAGEESGGFAFRGHIPERDGVVSGLLVLEYMAKTGKSPAQLVERLFDRVGPHYYHRRDVEFEPERRAAIQEKVNSLDLGRIGEFEVRGTDTIDGRRLRFDHGWLATRFSGTEPLLRIYAEADAPERVARMLDAAAEYIGV
jgi:phosphomannomutase